MNKLFDDDEPFLWLQADESEATASCGCTLMDDAQGARFHRCAVHGAAPDLLTALKEARAMLETASRYFPKSIRNGDRFSLLNTLANSVEPAIAKAEGRK